MISIALNTFREIIRSRFFSIIIAFSLVFFAIIPFFNSLALWEAKFIIADFWLSFIEISGLFVLLFLWNRILSREFEEKTIYLTLSRPIHRGRIIIGKFLGFLWILWLLLLIESIFLMVLFFIFEVHISVAHILALSGIFVTHGVLLALMLLFSVLFSPAIVTFLVLAFYMIGQSWYALLSYAKAKSGIVFEMVWNIILLFFPNFSAINFKNTVHGIVLPDFWHVIGSMGFLIGYLLVVLFLAMFSFSKKSFDNI